METKQNKEKSNLEKIAGITILGIGQFGHGLISGSTVGTGFAIFTGKDFIRTLNNRDTLPEFGWNERINKFMDKAYIVGRTIGQSAIAYGSYYLYNNMLK